MTATEALGLVGAVIGILTGLMSIASVVYFAGSKFSRLDAKVEGIDEKVNVIWEYLIRRAMSEAVFKGVATLNSPIVITEEAKTWMEELKPELQKLFLNGWQKLPDRMLLMEIEKKFGERIVRNICIPHGLHSGACLLIALQVAKEALKSPEVAAQEIKQLAQEVLGAELKLQPKPPTN